MILIIVIIIIIIAKKIIIIDKSDWWTVVCAWIVTLCKHVQVVSNDSRMGPIGEPHHTKQSGWHQQSNQSVSVAQ